MHRGIQKETGEEYAIKVIDKTSLSGHEKSLLRGEIGKCGCCLHPSPFSHTGGHMTGKLLSRAKSTPMRDVLYSQQDPACARRAGATIFFSRYRYRKNISGLMVPVV